MKSSSKWPIPSATLATITVAIAFCGSVREPPEKELSEGSFHFVRVAFNLHNSVAGYPGAEPWAHDYPEAERKLLRAVSELTEIKTDSTSHLVLNLADSAILKHPLLYFSEPGYWKVTGEEATMLREFLDQGGFVIFDDFRGAGEWENLVSCMKKVCPDRSFQKLTGQEPVFQSFFRITALDLPPPYRVPGAGEPAYYGLFSPTGKLLAIACFNTDLGDYWEWEEVLPAHQASLQLGINFIVYALDR